MKVMEKTCFHVLSSYHNICFGCGLVDATKIYCRLISMQNNLSEKRIQGSYRKSSIGGWQK